MQQPEAEPFNHTETSKMQPTASATRSISVHQATSFCRLDRSWPPAKAAEPPSAPRATSATCTWDSTGSCTMHSHQFQARGDRGVQPGSQALTWAAIKPLLLSGRRYTAAGARANSAKAAANSLPGVFLWVMNTTFIGSQLHHAQTCLVASAGVGGEELHITTASAPVHSC